MRLLPLIVLCVSGSLGLYAEMAPPSLSVAEVATLYPTFLGQEVSLRGFLYETQEGGRILAAEPNLKSCCVGAADRQERQVWVLGPDVTLPSMARVVVLRGRLSRDESGRGLQLQNAALVGDTGSFYCPLCIATPLLLLLLAGIAYRYRRASLAEGPYSGTPTASIVLPRICSPIRRNFSGLSDTKKRCAGGEE